MTALAHGFVYLDEALPGLRWDAKYATWDNFVGRPVDGYGTNRIVVSAALVDALRDARERAEARAFGLLVWDAYRPQRAVDCFVEWSEQPEDDRTKADFYPRIDRTGMIAGGDVARRSGHTRGSAVDLSIYPVGSGELVPMGGGHDLMDERSHHGAPGIPIAETWNRATLCSIMEASGFARYDREWWHYTLRDEPHPDRYFDFPIR